MLPNAVPGPSYTGSSTSMTSSGRRSCPIAARTVARKLAIDDQRLGLTMLEHERDRCCIEPGIERVQHGAGHRDAVVRLDHLRVFGSITATVSPRPMPGARQRMGQLA